ncbi:MAG: sulfotransferase [Pseudomonadota bacterium]
MTASDVHPLVQQGRAAANAGDFRAAIGLAETRLTQAPQDLNALELLALAQSGCGQSEAAIATLRRVLALDPACAWAHADLALELHRRGDATGAEMATRQGLTAQPDSADLAQMLGVLLSEREDLPGGERSFRRALALAGPHPQVLRNLASNLLRQGRLDEAEPLFAQAHASAPRDSILLAHWARLHEARGDFGRAHALLDQAERAGGDVGLQRAVTFARQGDLNAALRLLQGELGGDALLERGRILERLGRYDEAWADYEAGKSKLGARLGARYDAAAVSARFAALKAAFAPGRTSARAETRSDCAQPIFVLGFPRSGTTMIEQMLSCHSGVRAGGELPFLAELEPRLPEMASAEGVAALRDHYLARAADYGLKDGRFFTDKMPLNDVWLPLIRAMFPRAPVLRVRRHPLDVCVSMLSHHLTHGDNCGYRLADIAAHIAAVDDLTAYYESLEPGFVCEVRYERFVAAQEEETRRALAALGLDFEAQCLRFHENPRHAPTPSYAQVTEPLNDRSIGRWTRFRKQLEPVLPILAPIASRLGYAV